MKSSKAKPSLAARLADQFGLEVKTFGTPLSGYRNQSNPLVTANGQALNLIIFKNDPGSLELIRRADRLTEYLYQQGWPVRRRVEPRLMVLSGPRTRRYAGLYNFLPGSTIPWEGYTRRHLRALGRSLSDMHADLRPLPIAGLPAVERAYMLTIRRMTTYFGNPGVQTALRTKLGLELDLARLPSYGRLLTNCRQLPGRQALHMDFVRGNVLFAKNSANISGIIDFEKAAAGHPAFDVARTLAFLLVDCRFKTGDQVTKAFLRSGYAKYGRSNWLSPIDVVHWRPQYRLIEALAAMFMVYDFYKFLRHNPYEALAENQHFSRTRQLLLDKQLLTDIG